MSERSRNENRGADADEPLYTRAEVENMINEMLAAKLAELDTVFQQFLVVKDVLFPFPWNKDLWFLSFP